MSQVRVSENTHRLLRTLSTREGKPMQDILDEAVEHYRRRLFLEGLSNDFRLLASDPAAWAEHQEEMELWDSTIEDGIDNE